MPRSSKLSWSTAKTSPRPAPARRPSSPLRPPSATPSIAPQENAFDPYRWSPTASRPRSAPSHMNLSGKSVVVTGGANGIGRALCTRFAAEGARGVMVADLDVDAAHDVAAQIGGLAACTDVSDEPSVVRLVDKAK